MREYFISEVDDDAGSVVDAVKDSMCVEIIVIYVSFTRNGFQKPLKLNITYKRMTDSCGLYTPNGRSSDERWLAICNRSKLHFYTCGEQALF